MDDEKLNEKLEEQFNRFGAGLFEYLDGRFAEVNARIDGLESRMSSLESGVDRVLKNQETDDQERLAMNHQLDRHEGWIGQASKKLGVSYEH